MAEDVQVELVMLDPWVRATLKHNDQASPSLPWLLLLWPGSHGSYGSGLVPGRTAGRLVLAQSWPSA